MQKKVLAVMAAMACAFAFCFPLSGCAASQSDEERFVGQWEVRSLEDAQNGQIDLDSLKVLDLTVTVTFNEDGSCAMNMFGSSIDGTWKLNNPNAVTVTLSGQGDTIFTLTNGELVSDTGESKMVLTKVE